ncbi:hypothetical protein D3C81_1314320 [compost metagenome]
MKNPTRFESPIARANINSAIALITHCSALCVTAGTPQPTRIHTNAAITSNAAATINVSQPDGLNAGRTVATNPRTGTCGTTTAAAHCPPSAQYTCIKAITANVVTSH